MTKADHVDLIWAEGNDKNLSSQPRLHQHGIEVQPFGTLRLLPIALSAEARGESAQLLTRMLADTVILCALDKKSRWLVAGPTSHPLHPLFDQHAEEQLEVLRRHEMQVWFMAEHLVDLPLVQP